MLAVTASVEPCHGPSIIPPPGRCWGHFFSRYALDEAWRVVFAISATTDVAAGAYFAIRFIIGLQL